MLKKWVAAAFVMALCIVPATGYAQETAQPKPDASSPEEEQNLVSVLLTGDNAAEAFQVLSEATGFSIIVSGSLTNTKLFAAIVDMNAEDALEQIVKVNGLHYVRNDKVVWVLSDEEYYEDFNMGRVRRIIPLKHARADDIKAALSEMLSKNGVIVSYPDTNVVVLAEVKDRIDELEKLALELDRAEETRVFEVRHAIASDLAFLLQPYVNKPENLQPDYRTNQLVVKDTPENLERIAQLVTQFDRPDSVATRIFPLKYANAYDVAALLQDVLNGGQRGQYGMGGASGASLSGLGRQAARSGAAGASRVSAGRRMGGGLYQRGAMAGRGFGLDSGMGGTGNVSAEAPASASARTAAPAATAAAAATATAAAAAAGAATGAAAAITPQPGAAAPAPVAAQPGAAAPAATPAATAPGAATPAAGTPGAQGVPPEGSVGVLATVVADSRTNSVIVTHTQAMLERLAKIIESVDTPNDFHVYQFLQANPVEIDVATKLQGLLPADSGYVDVDEVSKKVVFRAPDDQANQIMQLLKEWDKARRQIEIAAEILSINVNLINELGITWEVVTDTVQHNIRYRTLDSLVRFPPAVGDTASQGNFRIGNIKTTDYSVLIQALSSDSDTQIIASPKILVRDGEEAVFSSTRDEPYTVVTVDGNTQTTLEDVRFLNIGVQLQVAPIINEEEQIILKVGLENSSLAGRTSKGVPIVDRATAESTVTVNNGGTLLLGGLRQRERALTKSGLPGLKSLPLLGHLFRSRRGDRKEYEIILVLKPSMMANSTDAAPTIGNIAEQLRRESKGKNLFDPPKKLHTEQPPADVLPTTAAPPVATEPSPQDQTPAGSPPAQ